MAITFLSKFSINVEKTNEGRESERMREREREREREAEKEEKRETTRRVDEMIRVQGTDLNEKDESTRSRPRMRYGSKTGKKEI